jgi:hypothetical protein
MPRRKSRREKIAAGTLRENRADRPVLVLPVHVAQEKATAASIALTEARQKAKQTKPKLTARQKRLAQAAIPVREVALECALEDLATAMKAAEAQAAAPSIRAGLELMSYDDCMSAQPPLSEDEELQWLVVGPANAVDLAQRKATAGADKLGA